MIAWMAYAALVGGIVAVGGVAMERLAAAMGRPRRIAWLAALALAVLIPLAGGWGGPAAPAVETVVLQPAATGGAVVGDLWSVIPALPVPGDMPTGKVALVVWGAGSLASLAVLAGVLVVVARGRRRWERKRVHGADVYVSRRFGPALVGVSRPEVVIPAWVLELEPGARDAIIRHEAEHARARDHLVLLCGGLVVAAFPWNPAIWWMYRRLRAAVEMDCDQRVLASGIGVADYGDVLLNAGCRSSGRWGLAPAMGQPESLLERRLKTMSDTRKKLGAGRTTMLVAVAVGAVVVACDTPVPTEVREAFQEVMADETEQGADAEREDVVGRFLVAARPAGSDAVPILFVDGVRIRGREDLPATAASSDGFPFVVADILRVEVLKGPAAAKQYGEEAAGGVIQIFTKDMEPVPERVSVPSVREFVVTELVEVETGPGLPVVPSVSAIAVREQVQAEPGDELVVRVVDGLTSALGVAQAEPEAELIARPSVRESVVTGQARDWQKWLSENARAGTPPDWKPVILVDGVRVDGGLSGLNDLHPGLIADRIDRVEVASGGDAVKLYGEEAVHGVILIFTKKDPSK